MEIEKCKSRLLELIKEKALKVGNFILASGKESNYYLDERIVTLSSEGAYLNAIVMLDMLKGVDIDAVGGPTLAADPIAGAISAISYIEGRPLDAFIVRKEPKAHGTGKLIEGPIKKGMKVCVVDGTMTTGGSLLKAIEALENEGCLVVKVLVLIDRLEGGREFLINKGYDFDSVFTRDDLI
ncbi:TPA: orotate phosphoribosyltransferase [bacterium]|nr:orotate phosphoribosyltransferase [bacterium]